jgi:hypothetical protein
MSRDALAGRALAASFSDVELLTRGMLMAAIGFMLATGLLATGWPSRRAGEGDLVAMLTRN